MKKRILLPAVLFGLGFLCCAAAPQTQDREPARLEAGGAGGDPGKQAAAVKELAEWRERIDGVDRELVALLNRRAAYVLRLAPLKRQIGAAVLDPQREREVRRKLRAANKGPLPDESVEKIYATIMAAMRDLQSEN
jgi:chorismate mutase/prephenate dehydratase